MSRSSGFVLIPNSVIRGLMDRASCRTAILFAFELGRIRASRLLTLGELIDLTSIEGAARPYRTFDNALKALIKEDLVQLANGFYYSNISNEQPERLEDQELPRHIPKSIRQKVFERDNYACTYCGCEEDLTLDHLLPWSRGGLHTLDNLVVACRTCNSSKNAKTPDEWAVHRMVN